MTRVVGSIMTRVNSLPTPDETQNIKQWLETQVADADGVFFLLAHADDGVIWGKVKNGSLAIAPETKFSPPLRLATLQSARLFGDLGEVLLWRDGDQVLHARVIVDNEDGSPVDYFDEEQILWGTQVEASEDGFTLFSDGRQGLRHIVPIAVEKTRRGRPLRLTVRHYLIEDENGFVRVVCSRLVKVFAEGAKYYA